MVAPKRGRGGRGQAAKARAAAQVEEPAPAVEPTEVAEAQEENNGEECPAEEEQAPADESIAEEQAEGTDQETTKEEEKPEEKKEEKVESGKLLVQNLPPSYLFDYQDKLKELFSKHGEVLGVRRGPNIVTEQTTTPTLSAIVEFKNKESLEKALAENGAVLEGSAIAVTVEARAETAVLVGIPYEVSPEYIRLLFGECGPIEQVHEFSKTKYKILCVTYQDKSSVEKALKLDRDIRINGFLVTVSKYRDDDDQKHNTNPNKNKRQHSQQQIARNNGNPPNNANNAPPQNRNNNFRGGRGGGGGGGGGVFNARGNFRGGRGRGGGFPARGGAFPRGGFAGGINNYMPPAYMPRPGGFMNDGQRPNKRLRQM